MGTIADSAVRVSEASSAAILILIGSRGQYDGRETVTCESCGRAQFNKGQKECVACRQTLVISLEPLLPDSNQKNKPWAGTAGKRAAVRLRELRQLLGISQRDLADAAGCARTLITKYENGRVTLTIQSFYRFAGACNVSLTELFDEQITVEQLAVRSLIRSPQDGQIMRALIKFLPKSTHYSRAKFLDTVSHLATHAGR